MATFDDLPFEIADQIVRCVDDTQDLCSFSMTCHRVTKMADRILSQRRRAFRIGFNQEPYPGQSGEDFSGPYPASGSSEEPTAEGEMRHTVSIVHEYLLSICRHRKLALFPKLIVMGSFRFIQFWASTGPQTIAREDIISISKALGHLGAMESVQCAWIAALKAGYAWVYIQLITLLLPNLRLISIRHDGITEGHIIPWAPTRHNLHKLRTVTISGPVDNHRALSLAWPFLHQKSLRHFYCVGSGRYILKPAMWPDKASPSMLTSLFLEQCFIADESLEDLFRHTPHLKQLAYSPQYRGYTTDISLRHVHSIEGLSTALSLLSGSLVQLYLSVFQLKVKNFNIVNDVIVYDPNAGVLDFSKFSLMRSLTIDWHLVLPWSQNEPSPESTPLATSLPPNIRRLNLRLVPRDLPSDAVPAHVRNLLHVKRKSRVLDALRHINILDLKQPEGSVDEPVSSELVQVMQVGKEAEVEVEKINAIRLVSPADWKLDPVWETI